MKLTKRFLALMLALSIMCGLLVSPAYASQIDNETYSAERINGKELTWVSIEGHDILAEVTVDEERYVYEYDEENNRVSKSINGIISTFTYDDDGNLISENRDGLVLDYLYEEDSVYGKHLSGLVVNDTEYTFVLDDMTVAALLNDAGDIVAQYEYQDGIATVFGPDSTGTLVEQVDESFIGNVNRIRYNSYYFDIETGWYYCGRFYDTVNGRFIDGTDEIGFDDVCLYDLSLDVERQALRLLKQSTYGKPISNTDPETWWNGLSTTELVARLIYGENTSNYDDQNAIGRCLLNRYHNKDGSGFYATSMRGICTQGIQFSSIKGEPDETVHARNPVTTSGGWENATYLACAIILSGYDIEEYIDVCGDVSYMENQTQFINYWTFKPNIRNGNGCIQYYINRKWNDLKDVIIPGVGTYTTIESLDDAYRHDFKGESNVHFLYK